MRAKPMLIAGSMLCIATGPSACGDPARVLSPDAVADAVDARDVEPIPAGRGVLRSYPEHVIADFRTEFTQSSALVSGQVYHWTFDDTAHKSGVTVSHIFTSVGRHKVTLRVTDQFGESSVKVSTINVAPGIAALNSVMIGIVPGGLAACGIDVTAAVFCWGNNEDGIIGDGTRLNRLSPVSVVSGGVAFSQIAPGLKHTCALSTSGEAYCWGKNSAGQLGDGTTSDHTTPTKVLGGLTFTTIDVGLSHSCAVTGAGTAYCWGSNELGQLGDGSVQGTVEPSAVGGGRLFSIIRTGNQHSCALQSGTGTVYCWGANYHGQIGNGAGGNSETAAVLSPTAIASAKAFTQLDAGASHNCAISANFVYCWGWNGSGQLGSTSAEVCVGTRSCMRNPTRVPGTLKMSAVGLGTSHSCGLEGSTGTVSCWGNNTFGQLGDGTTTSTSAPTLISGASLKSLRGGNGFTCGVGVNNRGYCWGINSSGTLGLGDTTNRLTPTEVPGLAF